MSAAFPPPPIRSPMQDERGLITSPWLQWLRTLYDRVGGPVASSNNDLTADLPEDAGIEELKSSLFATADGFNQSPPFFAGFADDELRLMPPDSPLQNDIDIENRIAAMAEEISVLRQQLQDLRQGTFQ